MIVHSFLSTFTRPGPEAALLIRSQPMVTAAPWRWEGPKNPMEWHQSPTTVLTVTRVVAVVVAVVVTCCNPRMSWIYTSWVLLGAAGSGVRDGNSVTPRTQELSGTKWWMLHLSKVPEIQREWGVEHGNSRRQFIVEPHGSPRYVVKLVKSNLESPRKRSGF